VARRPRTDCGAFPSFRQTSSSVHLMFLVLVLVVVAHWCGYSPAEVAALLGAAAALYWRCQPKVASQREDA
jgi:hypothetical protein